jgi:hypothetical protein
MNTIKRTAKYLDGQRKERLPDRCDIRFPDARKIMSVTRAVQYRLPIEVIADFYDCRIVSEHQHESQ